MTTPALRASCRNGSTRGISLIEVVVGLTLIGTLLAATLVASRMHFHHIKFSQEKIEALKRLGTFVSTWSGSSFSDADFEKARQFAGFALLSESPTQMSSETVAVRIRSRRVQWTEASEVEVVTIELFRLLQQRLPEPLATVDIVRPVQDP